MNFYTCLKSYSLNIEDCQRIKKYKGLWVIPEQDEGGPREPLKDDPVNAIFAVGGVFVLAIFVHQFIFRLVKENKSLKGLLPICAN